MLPTVTGTGTTPWVNGVYQDNLTCWQAGDPGYCGPSAIVRPGGNINFSYGSTYLYQQQNVSGLLPDSGVGLQVTGYNFGFRAKNGNGWDDGRTDQLMALVRFWDNTNGRGKDNLLYGTSYDLNYRFNWTDFNYNEIFTKPLGVSSIGQVQYGFIGRDNNGWAGPYGPEVTNISFRLNYSVDACTVDPLSSPTCPGYYNAITKITSAPSSIAIEPVSLQSPTVYDTVISIPTNSSASSPVVETATTQPATSLPTQVASNPTVTNSSAASTPSATNQQPKVGEVQTSSAPKSTISMSQILSIVGAEQSRISNVEKSVVQETVQAALSAAASATSQAESVAASAQSQSIASSITQSGTTGMTSTQQGLGLLQSSASLMQGNNPTSIYSLTSSSQRLNENVYGSIQSFQNMGMPLTTNSNQSQSSTKQDVVNTTVNLPGITYGLRAPNNQSSNEFEQPKIESARVGERGVMELFLESRSMIVENNSNAQQDSSVKRNVPNNDAAGNVTIESIAKQPAGYAQYFAMMQDNAFYAPKEIYRNQKTVDNARSMRGLTGGSDKLHQQMVDQQYR